MDGKSMPERAHRIDTSGLMENTTPTKIAQEFILQYYSVRSRYPESLYRFYRDDSIVTMGCHQGEKVIEGKKDIEQLFSRIGYQNCLNSVAAFSAHFVLPNCVSILVSGEMSQNDEISRRFCEAFNLISYDVNRFYVKSHMFHFQDEAFHDIAPPCNAAATSEETTQQPSTEFQDDNVLDADQCVEADAELIGEGSQHEQEEVSSHVATENLKEGTSLNEPSTDVIHSHEDVCANESLNQVESCTIVEDESAPVAAVPPVTKMTWAGVAGTSRANQISFTPPKPVMEKGRLPAAPPPAATPNKNGLHTEAEEKGPERVPSPVNGVDDKASRSSIGGGRGGRGRSAKALGIPRGRSPSPHGDSSRDTLKYPDDQMLFVGNVPRDCAHDDLRQLFEQFGKVLDLRINDSSQSRNGRSNANLPNYGFVVMESAEVVQTILEQRPLKLHGTQRINVEEKRNPSSGGLRAGGSAPYRGGFSHSRSSNTSASRR